MRRPRYVAKKGAAAATWAMTHAPANPTTRRSTVPSAGSSSPTKNSEHEWRWWRRLRHHGLPLLLYAWLPHGQLVLYHGLMLCHVRLLHGRLLLELHTWRKPLVDVLLLHHAWQRLLVGMLLLSLLRLLCHAGRGLLDGLLATMFLQLPRHA